MTTIAQTTNVLITGTKLVKEVLGTVLKAMDAAEAEKNSGADKKAWVIAFVESVVNDIGEKWEHWLKMVVSFIDYAKAFYNQFK